ncbi:MAG TPA: hypothetical protein VNS58_15855 [Puia sp.]|nr:hypothetical protein [Puia sp.]
MAFTLLFTACSKTGPKGDTGATGTTGATGAGGSQGIAGPAGSQIFSGSTAPADTLGNVGDFYINKLADSLYGPKTLSGWGMAVSLQGAQGSAGATGATGAAGTNGNTILSGDGPPYPTLGNDGDFYFDRQSDLLYGPKTNFIWEVPVSLRGQPGPQGQTGPQGPAGTANVIYYNWVAFKNTSWFLFPHGSNTDEKYFPINIPSLTSNILNGGTILVYIEYYYVTNGDTTIRTVIQAPTEFYNTLENNKKETFTFEASTGQLSFFLSDASDTNDPGQIYTASSPVIPGLPILYYGYLYRIILIPGGVQGTSIDPHSVTYKEVCSKYGIRP